MLVFRLRTWATCLPPAGPSSHYGLLHTSLRGSALVGGFTYSRGIHALKRRAFAFFNISGVEANIPATIPHYTHTHARARARESLRGEGILVLHPKLCNGQAPLSTLHFPLSGPQAFWRSQDTVKLCFLVFLLCPGDHLHRLPPDPSSELRGRPLPPAWLPHLGAVLSQLVSLSPSHQAL